MYGHPLLRRIMAQPVPAVLQTDRVPVAQQGSEAIRQTILLPIDESRISEMALAHVTALASSFELRVHLLNVQPAVTAADVTLFTSAKAVEMQRRAAGERTLGGAKRALSACRIDHVAEVAFGSPADEIVRCATASACSKIVMGTRGKGIFTSLIRRSVAHRVVRLAPVPVTLVTPNAVLDSRAAATRAGLARAMSACLRGLRSWRKRCCAGSRAYHAP
jgi:nucleotide-binding universal stress UspA family protein